MPDEYEALAKIAEQSAFPHLKRLGNAEISSGGLTKREWFAGQAIVAIFRDGGSPEFAADIAVRVADALIERLGRDA